jgi:peptidyl-prolyl cis-trans isomerase SurA
MRIISFSSLFLLFFSGYISAQSKIVDEIVAVVGDKRVLYSDVEQNYMQMKMQGENVDADTRCKIFEQLLIQKLLLNQSEVDSIEVSDSQVEMELNQRMQYFVNIIGSEQKLEEYYNKSIIEIKQDTYDDIKEQLLTGKMQSKITEDMKVTPSDVRTYFRNLPEDSLPYVNAEVEYNQILLYPKSSEQAIVDVREKLLGLRERILNGENFATLAVVYSDDAASAVKGGDIGWFSKADKDPEFAKAAFALKAGSVSKIVETSYGFFLIQCVERTDTRVHARQIFLKPKITVEEKNQALTRLDSIIRLVRLDSVTFEDAAVKFSQDEETYINGGQAVNNSRGGARWKMDEFEPNEYKIINNLKVGEISNPYETVDKKGKTVYKVIWLKERTNPHVANLKDDYDLFAEMATMIKRNELVKEWVEEKIKTTYLRLSDTYANCTFETQGWTK